MFGRIRMMTYWKILIMYLVVEKKGKFRDCVQINFRVDFPDE